MFLLLCDCELEIFLKIVWHAYNIVAANRYAAVGKMQNCKLLYSHFRILPIVYVCGSIEQYMICFS